MDVSIIIVNWNTRARLRNCIKSIIENAGPIEYEIIVVDNASTDASVEMVKDRFPSVVVIANDDNRGFASANNQGIEVAMGRYVLLLNSDTLVGESAIAKTVTYADKNPEAAVVGCQVWKDMETIQMTCFRFTNLFNLMLRETGLATFFRNNRILGSQWMHWWKRDTEKQVDVVSGMYMLVRSTAIDHVGPMDESFYMYYEETDWCYRFHKAGWKSLFYPGAKIIHIHGGGSSSNKVRSKMFVQFQKSLLIFLKKHNGSLAAFAARLILITSFTVRTLVWLAIMTLHKILNREISSHKQQVHMNLAALRFSLIGIEI
ncbi:MAG: glycosyltransferase family 2 protein [Planctomycetes bacterium]|nr:glycosyltransferase family 2 protein [Planctomycetota bacterium]